MQFNYHSKDHHTVESIADLTYKYMCDFPLNFTQRNDYDPHINNSFKSMHLIVRIDEYEVINTSQTHVDVVCANTLMANILKVSGLLLLL